MITSLTNHNIKRIRKLKDRKERQITGLFFAEGLRLVTEAIQTNYPMDTIIFSPELLRSGNGFRLIEEQKGRGIPLLEVSESVFTGLASRQHPQGLAAVFYQQWYSLDSIPERIGNWVALDAVQDPGNLGTILRTHDAVGGTGIIVLDQSTDPFDPTSVRASMGAIFCQKIIRSSLDLFSMWKIKCCANVIGTSGMAKYDYTEIRYPEEMILLMGSERLGLQDGHLRLCDNLVRIPMIGRSDSLNLAIATAIVLYEAFNQRRKG